jgi:hypothetical protein
MDGSVTVAKIARALDSDRGARQRGQPAQYGAQDLFAGGLVADE